MRYKLGLILAAAALVAGCGGGGGGSGTADAAGAAFFEAVAAIAAVPVDNAEAASIDAFVAADSNGEPTPI